MSIRLIQSHGQHHSPTREIGKRRSGLPAPRTLVPSEEEDSSVIGAARRARSKSPMPPSRASIRSEGRVPRVSPRRLARFASRQLSLPSASALQPGPPPARTEIRGAAQSESSPIGSAKPALAAHAPRRRGPGLSGRGLGLPHARHGSPPRRRVGLRTSSSTTFHPSSPDGKGRRRARMPVRSLPPAPATLELSTYTARSRGQPRRASPGASASTWTPSYRPTAYRARRPSGPGTQLRIPNINGLIQKVRPGDSLAAIAKRYKIDATRIVDANDLGSARLLAGQSIFIPEPDSPTRTSSGPSARSSLGRYEVHCPPSSDTDPIPSRASGDSMPESTSRWMPAATDEPPWTGRSRTWATTRTTAITSS